MKRFLKLGFLILAFGLVLVGSNAYASLIGDTVRIQYFFPSLADEYIPALNDLNVVVGAGIEVATYPGDFRMSIDIGADSIFMDYQDEGGWTASAFNGIKFSDLSDTITGFTLTTNLAGLDNGDVTFGADFIQINWQGLFFDRNTFVQLDLNSAQVPEPSTLLLLGSGLAGLGLWRRCRKTRV